MNRPHPVFQQYERIYISTSAEDCHTGEMVKPMPMPIFGWCSGRISELNGALLPG
jgi:hypothetical protein